MTTPRYRLVCMINATEKRMHDLRAGQSMPAGALQRVLGMESHAIFAAATAQDGPYVRDRLEHMAGDLCLSPLVRPVVA